MLHSLSKRRMEIEKFSICPQMNHHHDSLSSLNLYLRAFAMLFPIGDKETPVIVINKLSEEELAKLITVFKKHRSVLDYSIQYQGCGLLLPVKNG